MPQHEPFQQTGMLFLCDARHVLHGVVTFDNTSPALVFMMVVQSCTSICQSPFTSCHLLYISHPRHGQRFWYVERCINVDRAFAVSLEVALVLSLLQDSL